MNEIRVGDEVRDADGPAKGYRIGRVTAIIGGGRREVAWEGNNELVGRYDVDALRPVERLTNSTVEQFTGGREDFTWISRRPCAYLIMRGEVVQALKVRRDMITRAKRARLEEIGAPVTRIGALVHRPMRELRALPAFIAAVSA